MLRYTAAQIKLHHFTVQQYSTALFWTTKNS